MSDRADGVDQPPSESEVESAAWEAIVSLLGAAAAVIIVDGVVDLSRWPDDAWDPSAIGEAAAAIYAAQWPDEFSADARRLALEWVSERENLLIDAGDEVFEQVQSRVEEALSSGLSESETADQISQIMNPDTDEVDWRARAQRIARTEVHGAEQAGQDDFTNELVESGAIDPPRFGWVSAADERTRPDHMSVADVDWPDLFSVGGELLRYPGDPNGSASNVINCRCTKVRRQ